MNYSITQAGNLVKLVSAIMVLLGAKPFSEEETNAIIVVLGLVGQGVGFAMSWLGRYRAGGVGILGNKI